MFITRFRNSCTAAGKSLVQQCLFHDQSDDPFLNIDLRFSPFMINSVCLGCGGFNLDNDILETRHSKHLYYVAEVLKCRCYLIINLFSTMLPSYQFRKKILIVMYCFSWFRLLILLLINNINFCFPLITLFDKIFLCKE